MPRDTELRVCVWGADGPTNAIVRTALSQALSAPAPVAILSDVPLADLHFLLGNDADNTLSSLVADASLREQLDRLGCAYLVLYGTPASQVAKAVAAIERHQRLRQIVNGTSTAIGTSFGSAAVSTPSTALNWVWPCDKCGDNDCERKLLSRLLSQRNLTPED